MATVWGDRPLDQISASDIEAMRHQMAATARSRRNSRHGRHAGEHVIAAARTSGNDVVLDALLLRLHTETACRHGGALALRLADLDTNNCLIQLREKGSTVRWQPVSPALAASLAEHAACRSAVLPTDRLLRYHDGRALTVGDQTIPPVLPK